MTPAELKDARHALGLSAEGFARLVRVQSGRTVRRWEKGDAPIPGAVEIIARMSGALQHAGAIERDQRGWEIRLSFDNGASLNAFMMALAEFR